ncbi:MAG: RraA family protein [Saprospiraceae bacterium]|nr:RraA family protein [Saprospiraceae bacterium]
MQELIWKNDVELFELMRSHLFSAVVGDVMDQSGLLHQFLPPEIQPLRADMVVVGRAMTVWHQDLTDANRYLAREKPFGLMLEALDDLKQNEVYLASGASPGFALWGELMTARAMHLGAAGVVMNGHSRDTDGILALNFPTFSHGRYAQDQGSRGTVLDFRIPIEIAGVHIQPGDIVFGDMDGVCVIPSAHETDIIKLAWQKATGEKTVLKAIQNGMSAVEAFKTYGIM